MSFMLMAGILVADDGVRTCGRDDSAAAPPAGRSPARAEPAAPFRDRAGLLWRLLVAYAAVYCLWRIVAHRPGLGDLVPNRVAFLLAGAVVVALAFLATRPQALDPQTRRAWRLLTAAFLSIELGNLLWLIEAFRPLAPFTVAHIGWLSYFPLVLCGILSFPAPSARGPSGCSTGSTPRRSSAAAPCWWST